MFIGLSATAAVNLQTAEQANDSGGSLRPNAPVTDVAETPDSPGAADAPDDWRD